LSKWADAVYTGGVGIALVIGSLLSAATRSSARRTPDGRLTGVAMSYRFEPLIQRPFVDLSCPGLIVATELSGQPFVALENPSVVIPDANATAVRSLLRRELKVIF
jgi:hypothetical protein